MNKFCKITWPIHKKKLLELSYTHTGSVSLSSVLNKSIVPYLVHQFINCCGTPHVFLACAGACRGIGGDL